MAASWIGLSTRHCIRPLVLLAVLVACAAQTPPPDSNWQVLFDGTSTTGWRGYRSDSLRGWSNVDGALTRTGTGGDIVYGAAAFDDFELELEWKLRPAGNSGIFYRATESTDRIFENAPEYQILDNELHPDNKTELTVAGANYGLDPAPRDAPLPVGEWNQTRIIARGANVEHWLNGKKVAEYTLWSPAWEEKVKASKFVQWPSYGRSSSGFIGLQDHGDWVAYRNIRVRPLK